MLTKSYVKGAVDTPLIRNTIGDILHQTALKYATSPAILSVKGAKYDLCYAELWQQTGNIAAALLAMGLNAGDRVAILAPNCTEWALLQFATARAGLILVTLNPAYKAKELHFALQEAGCRLLVSARRFKNSDYMDIIGIDNANKLPLPLEFFIGIGSKSEWPSDIFLFDSLLAMQNKTSKVRLSKIEAKQMPDDPINIQFTSGTTGLPKAVTLSHFNIINNAKFVAEYQNFTDEDKVCIAVPLFHCFGMVMGNLACITAGASWIYPAAGFDPKLTLDAVENRRCTALYGVPTMFIAMLKDESFKNRDITSLRTGIMAGAPCPSAVMKQVNNQMNMTEVTICYGMTETSPVSFQTMANDKFNRRISTIGRVHPHVEARIVNANGAIAAIGEEGEVQIRGYLVMAGYWGNKAATDKVITNDGWMQTGDLGRLDKQGYCAITGRLKDIIIRGGENISPREIEELLHCHDEIEDAHIFGIKDNWLGEEVCAWVKKTNNSKLNIDDIREYCKANIAHFKVPRYVRLVEEFPMTASGKIQKFKMRNFEENKQGDIND